MPTNWAAHKAHRKLVAEDHGAWIGLLDGEGNPIVDLPSPLSFMAPENRNGPAEATVTIPTVSRSGVPHPVLAELIAENFGAQSSEGDFIPAFDNTRFVRVETETDHATYNVAFTTTDSGVVAPETVEVNAIHAADVLGGWPCPSYPKSWVPDFALRERDYAVDFKTPRMLGDVKFANQADGFTVRGPAESVIRRIIRDSFDAVNTKMGWSDDPHAVVSPESSNLESPEIYIRPTDGYVWETIAGPAAAAGVTVSAELWLPGDPIPVGMNLSKPVFVITVLQSEGANN